MVWMRRNSPKQISDGSPKRWNPESILLPDLPAQPPGAVLDGFADSPAGASAPLEVEVGLGKGGFILARAKRRADLNLLGIEYARAYAVYAADRARRANLGNIRILCAKAEDVFRDALPDSSVQRVHVYFPDPWPKRKHHRRRLIAPPFLREVYRVLKPGGQFLAVTDHEGYFQQIRKVLTEAEGFAACPFPMLEGMDGPYVGTNFQRKYAERGKKFFRAALMKFE